MDACTGQLRASADIDGNVLTISNETPPWGLTGCGCGTAHDPSCPFSMAPFYPIGPIEPIVLPSTQTNWHFTVTPMTAEQRIRALAQTTGVKIHLRADDEGWFVTMGRAKVESHPTLESAFEALLEELLVLGVFSR